MSDRNPPSPPFLVFVPVSVDFVLRQVLLWDTRIVKSNSRLLLVLTVRERDGLYFPPLLRECVLGQLGRWLWFCPFL